MRRRIRRIPPLLALLLLALYALQTYASHTVPAPPNRINLYDIQIFQDAASMLMSGGNPYSVGVGHLRFFNPWWLLIILWPVLQLPTFTALFLNAALSFAVYIAAARRLRLGPWALFFLLTSPFHLNALLYGAISWVVLLGLFMPAPLALIFFAIKPQIGLGLIAVTLLREYDRGGVRAVLWALTPVSLLVAIGLLWFGIPATPAGANPGRVEFFPLTLVLGIPMLIKALHTRDQRMGAASSVLLAPYTTFKDYLPLLLVGGWVRPLAIGLSLVLLALDVNTFETVTKLQALQVEGPIVTVVAAVTGLAVAIPWAGLVPGMYLPGWLRVPRFAGAASGSPAAAQPLHCCHIKWSETDE